MRLRVLSALFAAVCVSACNCSPNPAVVDEASTSECEVGGADCNLNAVECTTGSDCQSGVCDLYTGHCHTPTCTDFVQNGAESGIDCGGPDCAACATPGGGGGGGSTVVAATCSDGRQNGTETGVDCGGPDCGVCGDGASCTTGADCESLVCDPRTQTCAAATCDDGVKNDAEADVDCGGACPGCATGESCTANTDCASLRCRSNICERAPSTCTDGVLNGTETDVDCGGTCAECSLGAICNSGADCSSGTCTNGTCTPAPTCADGAQNGSERDVDCGGAICAACPNGGGCTGGGDCASGVCASNACTPCTSDAQCASNGTCDSSGACLPDTVAPTVRSAFTVAANRVRVRFSEEVLATSTAAGALNGANYCIERFDGDPSSCTPTSDFMIIGAAAVSADTVDLTLSSASPPQRYTVIVSNVVDLGNNVVGAPRHAEFEGSGPLAVVSATATGTRQVTLVFSRAILAVPDAAGSAGCTNPTSCAQRFKLVGANDLGAITTATVSPSPRDNEVVITHSNVQDGSTYLVIAANGLDADGFDNGAFAIKSAGGLTPVAGSPLDRASFTGTGDRILTFDDGPLAVNPFGDGSPFGYVFKYGGKVNIGPRSNGRGAVRMDPDGSNAEAVTFAIEKDVNPLGKLSANGRAAPFPSTGSAGCANNSYDCGPDNEDGRGLFSSGVIGGDEWIVIGAGNSSGPLSYIYMSRDTDPTLNLKYVDMSVNRTGNAESFSALIVSNERPYLGFPDSGPKRPLFMNLMTAPAATSPGVDTRGNGTGTAACNPSTHDACNLMAHLMPGIGASGTPANTATVALIDAFFEYSARLYLGNNGGIVRATTATPLDYANAPGDWTRVTPSATEYAAFTSITTNKLAGLEPADKALPQLAQHQGHLYVGRNTTTGPQLWRCDAATVNGPAPATATDCDAGDWVLVAGNTTGDSRLSQFNNANNSRITLVVANGPSLYVGFNNAVDGISLFQSRAALVSSMSDFVGANGCTAGAAGCEGLGGSGLGAPAKNTRIFDATSLTFGGDSYLYVTTGNGTEPVRVYRNLD